MVLLFLIWVVNGDAWYYIDISGGQQGSMSKWDLVHRAVTDQVKAETMIWKHGTALSWLPANQIEDLRLACGFKKPKDLPQQIENMDSTWWSWVTFDLFLSGRAGSGGKPWSRAWMVLGRPISKKTRPREQARAYNDAWTREDCWVISFRFTICQLRKT